MASIGIKYKGTAEYIECQLVQDVSKYVNGAFICSNTIKVYEAYSDVTHFEPVQVYEDLQQSIDIYIVIDKLKRGEE